jgi:hypothetical protein
MFLLTSQNIISHFTTQLSDACMYIPYEAEVTQLFGGGNRTLVF